MCSGRGVKPGRAFTLIEILVVVAIIALLIAVLLPSLSRARANTRAVICSSNLHQFALAFHMYQGENRDFVPRGGTQVSQIWVMLVARQLGDNHHYLDVEQVPVEKYPVYSCPERVRTLPFPFVDYVLNTMPSNLKKGEKTNEVSAPTPASIWKKPGRVLLVGDAAFEQGSITVKEGGTTNPELRQARENHERAKLWIPGTPFNDATMGSISRMDMFQPDHLPCQPTRRGGNVTHMRTFANWLYADMHVAPIPWLNGVRPCKAWLQMMGVLDPNLDCY